LIAAVAFPAGVAHWRPDFSSWPLRLAKVMLVPAFTEELVFRGLLIPARGEAAHPVRWMASGLTLFVVWHVVEALTFLPGAHLFLTVPFLACALVLGVACTGMRYLTGSLWPAVVFHGFVVFAWQAIFGGPDVAQLLSKA
jgi:predicted Abi (CAAX) family protease